MSTIWYNTEVEIKTGFHIGIPVYTTVTVRSGEKNLHDKIITAIETIRDEWEETVNVIVPTY